MSVESLVSARIKVDKGVWRKLKAEAVLRGVSVAELAGSILERHAAQFHAEGR